jgi:hypothetical protein
MEGSGLHEIRTGICRIALYTLSATTPYLVKDVVVVMEGRRRC